MTKAFHPQGRPSSNNDTCPGTNTFDNQNFPFKLLNNLLKVNDNIKIELSSSIELITSSARALLFKSQQGQ